MSGNDIKSGEEKGDSVSYGINHDCVGRAAPGFAWVCYSIVHERDVGSHITVSENFREY